MHIVVDRTKWAYGDGPEAGLLLNREGQYDILGFACLALGFTPDDIQGCGMPHDVYTYDIERLSPLVEVCPKTGLIYDEEDPNDTLEFGPTAFAADAAIINDDPDLSLSERETFLISLAADHKHTIEFVGEAEF